MVIGVDKAVTSRLVVSGKRFEILVDPQKALEFKKGANVDMNEILAYPAIYKDVRSTEMVGEQELQKTFGTTDVFTIAKKIIRDGDLQLTTEQRRQMTEQKKNQIAAIIAKKAINPQTNTPHPQQRILNVMEKAGVRIDPMADAELQVDKIVKAIKILIPIKFQKILFQLKIPAAYAGKCYSVLKATGSVQQEQWLGDGSLQINIEVLGGIQEELLQKLSNITHGNYESKILKREDV